MPLPTADTPLYNHPLPDIEQWLTQMGCEQDVEQLHCWRVAQRNWQAELYLEVEELIVTYLRAGDSGRDIQRAFKYSLSRQDVEDAIFSGP
jgi:hypothetical protein